MGTQPVSMYPHWTERWDGEDKTSWLWVAQKGGQGAVDISGLSLIHIWNCIFVDVRVLEQHNWMRKAFLKHH